MKKSEKRIGAGCGCGPIGMGGLIAGILSWSVYHSIGYAIFHAFLGWLYVLYYLMFQYQ